MLKIYTEVNAMQSEVGEMLNTYFIDPVSRTVCLHLFTNPQGKQS